MAGQDISDKFTLINPNWDRDTPCVPTALLTPSGPHRISIREATKRVDEVRQYCIIKSPGFASVAGSVKHIVLTPESKMFSQVAFTDGWRVWYGGGFFKETTKAQAAIVIHEVLHVALRHPQRGIDMIKKNTGHEYGGRNFNPFVWNLAIDCIVNLATFKLSWVEAPKCGAIEFKNMLESDVLDAWPPHKWSAEKLYTHFMRQAAGGNNSSLNQLIDKLKKALDKLRNGQSLSDSDMDNAAPPPGSGRGRKKRPGPGGEDILRRPDPRNGAVGDPSRRSGDGETDSDSLLNDVAGTLEMLKDLIKSDTAAEGRSWHSRVERAAAGDRPDGVMREAVFDLPESPTPWQTVLRRYMSVHVLPRTEPHTFKPGRQMLSETAVAKRRVGKLIVPFNPGIQAAKGIKKMVVCVDTSGSITEQILTYFCSEIQTIRNRTGAEIVIIAADCEAYDPIFIARHEKIAEKIKYKGGLRGGGGTDFAPAIRKAEEIPGAAVIVYLTDMMGPYPDSCRLPLIWAATMNPTTDPPIGRVVHIMDLSV